MCNWVFVDAADSSLNEVYSAFACAVIEFLVAFAWTAYVHVEHVDLDVFFVLLFQLNHVLERVHTAEVAAVRILVLVSAADALNERDTVRFVSVGLPKDFAACRTSCKDEAL